MLTLPELLIFKIERIVEKHIDITPTQLCSKLNLSKYVLNGLAFDAEYEITGFIHIQGDYLDTCSYKSVIKKDENIWDV